MHKLGVIVPYRNRETQLRTFLQKVPKYLKQQGIGYEIIVAEQMDEGSFNRGALLNAGALQAITMGCDYLVFHDVDLIPRYVDYSFSDIPIELVGKVVNDSFEEGFKVTLREKSVTGDYFGGAVIFPTETFQKINGYSNRYVGWGFEDNDLLERCKEQHIPLKRLPKRQICNLEPAFTFREENSYVECPVRGLKLNKGVSIVVTFRVEDLIFNENQISDEGCIFCIPGLDLNLSYTNFGTYKFEVFDSAYNSYSIHTGKLPLGITSQAVVTFKDGKVAWYLNGVKVGSKECISPNRFISGSQKMFLGIADPSRKETKQLSGQVSEVVVTEHILGQKEVSNLFSNSFMGFGYLDPLYWYSARVVNGELVPNLGSVPNSFGYCSKCTLEPLVSLDDYFYWTVPWNRGGTFSCLPHKTNGSIEGSWRSWETRMNQQRYRDVENYGTFKHTDGLSTVQNLARISVDVSGRDYCRVQVLFKNQIQKLK